MLSRWLAASGGGDPGCGVPEEEEDEVEELECCLARLFRGEEELDEESLELVESGLDRSGRDGSEGKGRCRRYEG